MACNNCNHTMHGLGKTEGGQRIFWCPRCGSVKTEWPNMGAFPGVNPPSDSWDAPRYFVHFAALITCDESLLIYLDNRWCDEANEHAHYLEHLHGDVHGKVIEEREHANHAND